MHQEIVLQAADDKAKSFRSTPLNTYLSRDKGVALIFRISICAAIILDGSSLSIKYLCTQININTILN